MEGDLENSEIAPLDYPPSIRPLDLPQRASYFSLPKVSQLSTTKVHTCNVDF